MKREKGEWEERIGSSNCSNFTYLLSVAYIMVGLWNTSFRNNAWFTQIVMGGYID